MKIVLRKKDIGLTQNGFPSPREPPEGIHNNFKLLYRIEIGLVEKKIIFNN